MLVALLGCGRSPAVTPEVDAPRTAGPTSVCNVCGTTASFSRMSGRPQAVCPVCGCFERHRLLMHYLAYGSNLLHETLDVLHFSPMQCEETALRHQPNWNYVTSDFEHPEDLRLDLRDADQPDASWDLLILYHVLEHIQEDRKALREMYRILRAGGRALLQVPLEIGQREILEDPSVVDPRERAERFGQSDHVRKYSARGLRRRLEAAGFEVEVVDYLGALPRQLVERHRLAGQFDAPLDESIWIAAKPSGIAARRSADAER